MSGSGSGHGALFTKKVGSLLWEPADWGGVLAFGYDSRYTLDGVVGNLQSTLIDQSPYGNNATEGVAAQQMVLTTALAGELTLTKSGLQNNNYVTTGGSATGTDWTLYWIVNNRDVTTSNQRLFISSNATSFRLEIIDGATSDLYRTWGSGFSFGAGTGAINQSAMMYVNDNSGGKVDIWRPTGLIYTGPRHVPETLANGTWGGNPGTSSTSIKDCDFGAFGCLDRAATADDRSKFFGFAARVFGVTT